MIFLLNMGIFQPAMLVYQPGNSAIVTFLGWWKSDPKSMAVGDQPSVWGHKGHGLNHLERVWEGMLIFLKIAQLVLDPHLFSAKDCYPVLAAGSSDSCLGRQNLSNIKRFTGYTVYVCICVMVLKTLEDLNFQMMKYIFLSGNTRYMLHVFDCYETCWYTVYYILFGFGMPLVKFGLRMPAWH